MESVVYATIFLAGLAAGSFLNVVIHRGPVMWKLADGEARGNLIGPRSYCPACKTTLAASSLIPVVSYLAQRARCAACGAKISARYPVVELLGALSALLSVLAFGLSPAALVSTLFGLALIALAFIDAETGYLPDAITLPLIAVGLAANGFGIFISLRDAAIGAGAGFLIFSAISVAYERLRGKEGLGLGDAKLLAAIGAFGGWMILPAVVFVAALGTLAALGVYALMASAPGRDQPVPFGPGLCAAGFAVLIGERLFSGL